tara:strand:+ start:6579 stop:6845 length:267 start_codon:yes stop_codon:yes gene_type:complete
MPINRKEIKNIIETSSNTDVATDRVIETILRGFADPKYNLDFGVSKLEVDSAKTDILMLRSRQILDTILQNEIDQLNEQRKAENNEKV